MDIKLRISTMDVQKSKILNLKKKSSRFILSLVLPVIISGCTRSESGTNSETPPPPLVKIAQPLQLNTTDWDEYTGRIEAVSSVDIRARVGGYLEKINFTAGEKVNKGDLLFLIDQKPYKAQMNFASAELERAKTRQELAKNDLQRAENLFREKAISTEEFDTRSKGWREAIAAVASAEANLYTAKINLDYCEIRAPISGSIGRELMTAGNLVTGGDTTILTTIVSTDPIYVYVDADEQSVLKYRRQVQKNSHGSVDLKGTPIDLAVADETDYPHQGHIDYVSPREDAATGTVTLRGVFSNKDELLSPGFFARVRVRGSSAYQAMLIPDRAIATDQAQRFVWVMNLQNQVEYRKVILGVRMGQMRVIKQGLDSGEWVIVEGLQKLKPSIIVNPERITLSDKEAGV
ncbi:efflux RND transporter periplasmic adaptor subunit [Methylomonas sp. AM2-LC]|uniref:efflux RND transporter periplasmic adaptor subunit n=1 Tax=Methylomonas sp. AM2-LC TaxID=3153301 RepID=UPI003266A111